MLTIMEMISGRTLHQWQSVRKGMAAAVSPAELSKTACGSANRELMLSGPAGRAGTG